MIKKERHRADLFSNCVEQRNNIHFYEKDNMSFYNKKKLIHSFFHSLNFLIFKNNLSRFFHTITNKTYYISKLIYKMDKHKFQSKKNNGFQFKNSFTINHESVTVKLACYSLINSFKNIIKKYLILKLYIEIGSKWFIPIYAQLIRKNLANLN